MWLGLYMIAFSLFMFGAPLSDKTLESNWFTNLLACLCALGLVMFPIITIAYGISLIINN